MEQVFQIDAGYKGYMSHAETQKPQAAVRLRRPERRQVAMVVQCPDDLVSASHAVRMVMGVVSFIVGSPVSIVRGMGIIICKRGRLECENLMVSILGSGSVWFSTGEERRRV